MIRSIWKLFRVIGYAITGQFTAMAETWNENTHVVAATYDKSIEKNVSRINTVKQQVANLMTVRNTLKADIESAQGDLEEKTRYMNGAKAAMQKQINALKSKGLAPDQLKAEMQNNVEFAKANSAYKDLQGQVSKLQKTVEDKTAALEQRQQKVEQYKRELQSMQRNLEELRAEKGETISDIELAKQEKALNDAFTGLSEDTTDKDLAAVRATAERLKNEAQISAELAGNEASNADADYEQYAIEQEAESQLDELLDWGDDTTDTSLSDAQIAE